MPMIPNIPSILPDELLYSYLLRVAQANGFANVGYFLGHFVWPEFLDSKKANKNLLYDLRNDIRVLAHVLGEDAAADFFCSTSIFPGIAPLMTREQASHHIGLLSVQSGFKKILSPLNSTIQTLKLCPICQAEDRAHFGTIYYHRAHQMPGVTACYQHGVALHEYTGQRGRELLDQTYTELPSSETGRAYAVFCRDFLNADLQCSVEDIFALIRSEFTKRYGIGALSHNIMPLIGDYAPLLGKESFILSMEALDEGGDLNRTRLLALLLFLFDGVEGFSHSLCNKTQRHEFDCVARDHFTLSSPWREDVIMVKCNSCGNEFITSPNRIISGWGCPECSLRLSENEIFQQVFDARSKGHYELLGRYQSNRQPVELLHKACGKRFSAMPCDLLDTPILTRKRCPACAIRTTDRFQQEIRDLVGDEYTLVGQYVDKDTQIEIRHNQCGRVQAYYPRHFLDGARCKACRPFTTNPEWKRVVSEISCGRYVFQERINNNLVSILDTMTGETKTLSHQKVLQELQRPTPSPILPLDDRNLNITAPQTQDDIVFAWLQSHYPHGSLIFTEDVHIEGMDRSLEKRKL